MAEVVGVACFNRENKWTDLPTACGGCGDRENPTFGRAKVDHRVQAAYKSVVVSYAFDAWAFEAKHWIIEGISGLVQATHWIIAIF